MQRSICTPNIKTALANLGWNQKELAESVGVTSQAVTNWMKGTDFPRPDKLLKLAKVLKLGFGELVEAQNDQPVVAFKKRGGTKTTEQHRLKAMAMGAMLKPLVSYLPKLKALRTKIASPSLEYENLQSAAAAVREKLGIGMLATLQYEHIISEFDANDAVIIPVMWGQKSRHENALHILLPSDQVTFIYLNLDTYIEDFKFWMAHELAHVYTPELAGQDAGEDFADAFAGALLFPQDLARVAHTAAISEHTQQSELGVLERCAGEHQISIYTVFCEIQKYAQSTKLSLLRTQEKELHAVRTIKRGELVSQMLFKPLPPEPSVFIAAAQAIFQSHFFVAMQRMLRDKETGSGYLQQVLDISIQDAMALHTELVR
jgi:transcriptional regulator with XRE-family HTH domain